MPASPGSDYSHPHHAATIPAEINKHKMPAHQVGTQRTRAAALVMFTVIVMSAEALEKASEERAGLIASRAGEVLGAHTILKEDHFPGCQSAKLPNIIPGAPNFRGVPGQNVYGSALPTVDGIKEVLEHIGAASRSHDKRQVCLLSSLALHPCLCLDYYRNSVIQMPSECHFSSCFRKRQPGSGVLFHVTSTYCPCNTCASHKWCCKAAELSHTRQTGCVCSLGLMQASTSRA